jgi:hypothetical protein
LSKAHNWKSPGSDKIPSAAQKWKSLVSEIKPNYWLKVFLATHSYITKIFNTII